MMLLLQPMRMYLSKIALLILLVCFSGELCFKAVAFTSSEYVLVDEDEGAGKKEEESKYKEDGNDKIFFSLHYPLSLSLSSDNRHADFYIKTDSHTSLPEMPPDIA